jgi:acetyl esterase
MPLDRFIRSLIAWQRAGGPSVPDRDLTVEQARERYLASSVRPHREDGPPRSAVATAEHTIATEDGSSIRCRVYTPESDEGRVITFLHDDGVQ